MPSIQHKRGTLSQIDSAASSNQLKVGEVYLATDEERLTVATAVNAHAPVAKQSEISALAPFIPIARVKFDATSGAIAGVVQYGLNTAIGTSGVQYISAGTYDLNFDGTYTTTTFAVIGDGLANRKVSLSIVTSSSKIRITRNRTTDGITENGWVFCIVFADPA